MIQTPIESYVCPTAPLPSRNDEVPGYNSYRGNIGYWPATSPPLNNGLFYGNSNLDDRDVIDGLSNTIMFGETQHGMFWSDAHQVARVKDELGDPMFDRLFQQPLPQFPVYLKLDGSSAPPVDVVISVVTFGSFHADVLNVAYADGSVRSTSKSIDGTAFRAMCTRNGREAISVE